MENEVKIALLNSSELETAIELAISKSLEAQEIVEKVQKQEEHLQFYTIREACKLLSCCRTTIYNWCRQGLISYRKVGRKVLFSKENLENCGSSISFENHRMNFTINRVENA